MQFTIGVVVGVLALQTLDGHQMELSNFDEREGTVLLFMSSRCLVTEEGIEEINRIHERFRHQSVLFVGVCSDDRESSEEVLSFCHRRGVRFPVYRDPNGALAKQFGVRCTPEGFLLDSESALVYRGGFGATKAAEDFEETIVTHLSGDSLPHTEFSTDGTPIDQLGEERHLDNPYGSMSFSSELIFEEIPGAPVHHCSTMAEAANGDLICVWYGGSYESSDDQVLFLSRRVKGRRVWSQPEVLVKGEPLRPPGNACVFQMERGRIGLVWGRMEASRPLRRGGGWGDCQLLFRSSDDNGFTWSEDTELEGLSHRLPRNVPIRPQEGRIVLPITNHGNSEKSASLLVTQDNGETWGEVGAIDRGSQPTVIQRRDGSLLAFLRSEPHILKTESYDGGETWTAAEGTDVKCPGAGIAMRQLQNGHVVLVHNDSTTDRTPLSIRRSLDDGASWGEPLQLESNPGEYSYPCVIQTSDGKIHITYTFRRYSIKHVEMNEDWLVHMDRPN